MVEGAGGVEPGPRGSLRAGKETRVCKGGIAQDPSKKVGGTREDRFEGGENISLMICR